MNSLPEDIWKLVRCPRCRGSLARNSNGSTCAVCNSTYPFVGSIPILIDDERSVFRQADFLQGKETYLRKPPRFQDAAVAILPKITPTHNTKPHYARFAKLLAARKEASTVLVVGSGIIGDGMEELVDHPDIRLVDSDASIAPRTQVVCDAQQLPFADESFDGVVSQWVIEHLADPFAAASEMERVLKPGGLVYAAGAFMQQVHGGRYDFYRFTHLGLRRMFRNFEDLESGAVLGPGTALAWAWEYFLLSFTTNRPMRILIKAFVRLTTFWPKYFDAWLIKTSGGLDAASGVYFLGRKGDTSITDRDLVDGYRGAV